MYPDQFTRQPLINILIISAGYKQLATAHAYDQNIDKTAGCGKSMEV